METLFAFRNRNRYGTLKTLIANEVDSELIRRNWDDLLRLAASIREGKVSASLLVSKLAAYPQHSETALALRERGRVERTLFTLEWLQEPELRRRSHAGLNKGELRNSLALNGHPQSGQWWSPKIRPMKCCFVSY
jgi:TnpA family transposase